MRFLLSLLSLIYVSQSLASEIFLDPRVKSGNRIVIEGIIEPGDFDKFQAFVFQDEKSIKAKVYADQVYIASPGGDLTDSMRIGHLIRDLKMSTMIPTVFQGELSSLNEKVSSDHGIKNVKDNYKCSSACFFIFVAGVYRKTDFTMDQARLGIHKPYLSESELKKIPSNQAMQAEADVKNIVTKYNNEMGVPAHYTEEMFLIPKHEVKWIPGADLLRDFDGFIPQLQDWADARCSKTSPEEKAIWEELKSTTSKQRSHAENLIMQSIMEKKLNQSECEINLASVVNAEGWANHQDNKH